jgi:hypothetical protein
MKNYLTIVAAIMTAFLIIVLLHPVTSRFIVWVSSR